MSARRLPFRISDSEARQMYSGSRGNASARRYARFWSSVFAAGLSPRRWVTLEVPGRKSGRRTRFPLGMADVDGRWYLVSMLGEDCHWVRNTRAAGAHAVIRHGRARRRLLVEVPVDERAPIIRRYLEVAPGARPHIPVDRTAPLPDFERIAARFPVFAVVPDAGGSPPTVPTGRAS